MSKSIVPDSQTLWERHVGLVLKVLELALEKLRLEKSLYPEEEGINRLFYLNAKQSYFDLPEQQRPHFFALMPTSENVPQGKDDLDAAYIRKRPDFKWRLQDNLAQSLQDHTKDFDIECKRLGKTINPNWNFCRQYVIQGIARFISKDHSYGNNVSSGAMIGYIQSLSPSILLADINRHINSKILNGIIPDIDFHGQDAQKPPILIADQSLKRNEVQPFDFSLFHLWVNLCPT